MNTGIKPVRGKVARVLSEREVAINRGSNDGVELGMRFNILNSSETQEIKDPDTGETLGHVERVKIPVRVTSVNDKLAVAETFRFRRVNVGGKGLGLGVFIPPKWRNRYEKIRENDGKQDKTKGNVGLSKPVSIGDPVVQIIEPGAASARESARAGANA